MRAGKVLRLDLKKRLILWALLLSGGCLVATSAGLLIEAGRRIEARSAWVADLAAKAVALQAQQASWISVPSSPPDAERVAALLLGPGMCMTVESAGREQYFCAGVGTRAGSAPNWFTDVFGAVFGRHIGDTREIRLADRKIGLVRVDMDRADSAAEAWSGIVPVLATLAGTLLILCCLLYLALRRVLAPTQLIQEGLRRLAADDLSVRLPPFDLGELSEIGTVFNRLARRLEEALAARDALMRQIVTVQDDERRSLARDLHDEFGQYLAGTAALLAAMRHTAARDCPAFVRQCETTEEAVAGMMASLRDVLLRLRPPELDALGLPVSLRHMIAVWNGRSLGKTIFEIETRGDATILQPPIVEGLYRIAQEALTNAARHADATRIVLDLAVTPGFATLTVQDDGVTTALPWAGAGLGMLGMQERAASMGGQLTMRLCAPRGLMVSACIPLQATDVALVLHAVTG